MRVVIVSRIFAPEPAAAAFRLAALAAAFADAGHDVEVLTARLPRGWSGDNRVDGRVRIRRASVLRDGAGVVRGYLPYLSFDLPLFWRLLVVRRADIYVVEPPPTTGLMVAAATALLGRPFVYYAADVLADAASSAGSPAAVVRVVRWMEKTVWHRAARVLSVSRGVTARLDELGVPSNTVVEVGNGVDISVFTVDGTVVFAESPYALYAGTASEVHGAGVFVEAIAQVAGLRLVVIGSGAEIDVMRHRADQIAPGRVEFHRTMAPAEVACWLRGAAVAVASVKPDGGYHFAFPTKLYAAAACGTPLLFSGEGPGVAFVIESPLGRAVPHSVDAVARALNDVRTTPPTAAERQGQARWAREVVDLSAPARRSASAVLSVIAG
jgi:hypothetical protein